jgi:hypothetical protein
LVDELALELLQKLEVELVFRRQSLFTHDSLHGLAQAHLCQHTDTDGSTQTQIPTRSTTIHTPFNRRTALPYPKPPPYLDILADGITSIELVGDIAMITSGHAFTDGGLHEP